MEDYRLSENENSEIFHLEVDEVAKVSLLETARWMKFLGIIAIVSLSLLLLGGLAGAVVLSSSESPYSGAFAMLGATGLVLYFLVIIVVQIYPIYCLMAFSKNMKRALSAGDKLKFNEALSSLKGLFKYIGVITIIAICLYGLGIVMVAITTAMRM